MSTVDNAIGNNSTPLPAIANKPKSKRILELDALRAIAALNLLLFHFTYVFESKYGGFSSGGLGFSFPYGKYGVQLFFMLSGFVNAMTLLRRRSPKDFVAGRCIRIFPSFWLVVLLNVGLLSMFAMFGETVSAGRTAANMTVMPNLFGYECMEPVTWTLQIEMLFYAFLLLLLVTGLIEKPLPTLMVAMVVCLISSLGLDWLQATRPEFAGLGTMAFLKDLFIIQFLPLFSMGILLNEIKSKRGSLTLNAIGIFMSAIVFHVIDHRDHNPAATALLFAMLALSAYGKLPILRFKPLMFISTISYSLYLFHNNLGTLLMRWADDVGIDPRVNFVLIFAFSVAISAAITFWLEQPTTKFLRAKWAQFKQREKFEEREKFEKRDSQTPRSSLVGAMFGAVKSFHYGPVHSLQKIPASQSTSINAK